MAATMDDKTPCRKLINCIFNRFFYGFDFGFISWICSSHLNNKYKLFHSWLVYIVLFKAAPKRVSLVFSRLTFLCNNSPASPLWNFPEARNRKGTGRAYKWGKYVMLIRGGGSNNQFWIHYLWEGLIEQFICDAFNWGELISDWLNIILCQTIIWSRFSFISPVPQTLCLSLLLSLTSPWRDPTLFSSVLIDKPNEFFQKIIIC